MRSTKVMAIALILILFIGLLSLYSSCHQKGLFVKADIFYKQLIWAVLGICVLVLVSRWHYRTFSFLGYVFYAVLVVSLVVVLIVGRSIMGAQRWFSFGFLSFQPSEIGKIILIITLAKYFASKTVQDVSHSMKSSGFSRSIAIPFMIVFLPVFLVLIQPDLGTAVVYLFLFMAMAFLAEVRAKYLAGFLGAGLLSMPFFWHFLKDYQKSRLLVFLNPNIDPLGAGYTVIQSKIAIGSGRLFGKGWLSGTQSQLNFLAERHTDFIFSVIGEEWGLFGGALLLLLYAVLILAIFRIALGAKDMFGRLLAAGIGCLIFFQVFVNLAMNIGLSPIVGLPLPFISYGGSSLVISLASIGIVFNVARQR